MLQQLFLRYSDDERVQMMLRAVHVRRPDGASISPVNADYPRVHLDCHEGNGFVFQCYEDGESWSDFLVTSREFSTPSVEMELGGQALERWPRELFVSVEYATHALNHFLDHGKQDPALEWIRIDGFPFETL